jgi:translocation and assembly module TamB
MRRRILIASALILLLPALLAALLIYTPLGVRLAATQLHRLEAYGIRIEGAQGTISGPLVVERFELDHPRVHIVAHDIRIDPQMRGLAIQTIRTGSITARDVDVAVRRADLPPSNRAPRFLPRFLRIDAHGAQLERVRYTHLDGRVIEAERVEGRVTISSHRLRVRDFTVRSDAIDVQGNLRLLAADPLGIRLITDGTLRVQPNLPVAMNARLEGTVERFTLDVDVREPSVIKATGVFDRREADWRLAGEVTSPAFGLDPWLERPPLSFTDIALQVVVTAADIRTRGTFDVPEYDLNDVGLDARGAFADRVLQILASELTLPGSRVRVHTEGTLTFAGGAPDLNLAARWTDFRWPLTSDALVRLPEGTATLRGTLPYDITMNAEIDVPNAPPGNGIAEGVLSSEGIEVARYELQTLDGTIGGRASLSFGAPRRWQLDANVTGVDPSALHDAFPGRVSFASTSSGTGFDTNADFHVKVKDLRGTLRGEPIRGFGELERNGRRWTARDIDVALGPSRLMLDGHLADDVNARWTFITPALQRLWPQAQGAIEFSGRAQGKRAAPRLVAALNGRNLAYGDWTLKRIELTTDLDATNTQASTLALSAEDIEHGGHGIHTLQANGNGTLLAHRLALELAGHADRAEDAPRARMDIQGSYDKGAWTATIPTSQFARGGNVPEISTVEPAAAVVALDRVSLDNFCFAIEAGRLCAGGRWQRNGAWEGTVSGYEIPLAFIFRPKNPEVEYAGRLEGSARAFGGPGAIWQGEAGMKISDVAIIYSPQGEQAETLNLGTGGMHLVAGVERIDFSFGVQAFTDTFLHTNLHLLRHGRNDILDLPLSGSMRARAADANLLPLAFPDVDRAAGVLTAEGTLHGTLSQPELNGRVELIKGELDSYRANFALRDLDVLAMIAGTQLTFRGTGTAGDGRLDVDGSLRWQDGESRGRMHLRGSDLLVADLPEYRVVASPNLRFDIEPQHVRIEGDVLIPSARIQPARLTGAVGPSSDARFVGEHIAEREGRFKIESNVRVEMGKDVRVDAFGLHARIEGGVTTSVRTGELTTGHGELRVAEGRYEAYGQQLEISRGQLLFDNAVLEDPGLDIEARRRIETVTVGLNVRGTLQEPRLTFFSDPTMPQTQIVSYLLVGKSLGAGALGDADDNASPGDTLALQGGGFLASQLGRRIGIEEVGIENYINSAGEANPSLVLGKFLSPRLFISYGISLTESINTLKLRYTISDRWIFRTESGEAQSADLEYTIER